jgi:hypothetical protein
MPWQAWQLLSNIGAISWEKLTGCGASAARAIVPSLQQSANPQVIRQTFRAIDTARPPQEIEPI